MVPTVAVVLHVPQGVTLEAYLVRILVYLLAFVAVAVATLGCLRTIAIVRSTIVEEQ